MLGGLMRGNEMIQDEINQHEWQKPDNWSGPKWISVYFSKKDSRTWVPKQIPAMGWTINLGSDSGVYWLIGVLIGIPLFVIIVNMIVIASIT